MLALLRRGLLLLSLAALSVSALRRDVPKSAVVAERAEGLADGCIGRPPLGELREHLKTLKAYTIQGAGTKTAVVTYAGVSKQSYIDGAVMLGRSLARLNLGVPQVCLVGSDMADESKDLLRAAGWDIREVTFWLPQRWVRRDCGYWHDVYNKVDIFRLPFDKVLYMDSDTYVFGKRSDMLPLVREELRWGEIKMVQDVNGKSFNSGVMVFRPNEKTFEAIHEHMATGQLDQPAINKVFAKEDITELPFRYNVHGYGEHNCSDVVIAHFTGLHKPAEAERTAMANVSSGAHGLTRYGLACQNLYIDYFKEMHKEVEYLSPELRTLLSTAEFDVSRAGRPLTR